MYCPTPVGIKTFIWVALGAADTSGSPVMVVAGTLCGSVYSYAKIASCVSIGFSWAHQLS